MTTKHVTAYYIDARDGRPANESPLRHGPAKPSETMIIDAVDRRQDQPLIIGRIPVDESLSPGMTLISEQEHADMLADHQAWLDANGARTLGERRAGMVVSAFQAFAAMDAAGYLDQVEAMMADPETPRVHRLAFQKATEFRRLSPTVDHWKERLLLTEEQLDELFDQAAEIVA